MSEAKPEFPEIPQTIRLAKPIERKNGKGEVIETIEEVEVKRWPEFDDIEKVSKLGGLAADRRAINLLTELPDAAVGKLRADDYGRIMAVINPLFEAAAVKASGTS